MVGVEAMIPGGDRPSRRHLLGLALGFIGILLLVGPRVVGQAGGGWAALAGLGALQIAAAGWSMGSAFARRHVRQTEPLASAAMQMLGGAVVMIAMGTVAGEWPAVDLDVPSAAALLYLAIAGSLVAFAAYVYALEHLPVSFMSLYAYINPLIAVALGTFVLGEPFDLRMAAGIAIVLAGVAVVSAGGPGEVRDRSDTPASEKGYRGSRGFRKARLSRVW
jgi:drug/metabolite transporter (DMT)-like permease